MLLVVTVSVRVVVPASALVMSVTEVLVAVLVSVKVVVAVAEVVKVNDVVSVAVVNDGEIVEVLEPVVDDAELVISIEV